MPLPAMAVAGLVSGGIQAIGSLFGAGARRRELQKAQQEMEQRKADYTSFQFENPFAGIENPFEDATVATQAAEFQAQQQQQALANTLGGLKGAAGGSGVAALAQAMAQQQSQNLQAASASIAQQEQAIQQQRAATQTQLNLQEAQGEQMVQQQEFDKRGTLLGMSQQRLGAARQAQAQARQQFFSGLGSAAGALAGGLAKNAGSETDTTG